MEVLAFIPMIISFFIPFILIFLIYAGMIALVIWFIISFFKIQRERNQILKSISRSLQKDDTTPDEKDIQSERMKEYTEEMTNDGSPIEEGERI